MRKVYSMLCGVRLWVALLLVAAGTSPAFALRVGYLDYTLDNEAKTATLTIYYSGLSGDLVIPGSVTSGGVDYAVTAIAEGVFKNVKAITSVTIPNSVTSIGNNAFNGCDAITKVTIEDGETTLSLGNDIFSKSLESVYLGRNITYSASPFTNQTKLESVKISNSVTSIGSSSFSGCSSLAELSIPNSVASIGDNAFSDCSSLTEVTIPNSVTSIGSNAFSGCSSLADVTIPNSVTSIGDRAFYGCSSLTEVTIPNSVTSIGGSSFSGCSSLTEVTIPNSVTSIGGSSFSGCSSLTEITIPNSVTSIGDLAFSGCSSLTEITIPNSVTSIGREAFSGCDAINKVIIEDGETTLNFNRGSGCFSNTIELIYIGRSLDDSYHNYDFALFSGQTKLTSIVIGSMVTYIGSRVGYKGGYAFSGCSSLETITAYPSIPPSISENTFPISKVNIPAECERAYRTADVWKDFTITTFGGFEYEGFLYSYSPDLDRCAIMGYTGEQPSGDFVIPAEAVLDGVTHPVTAIASGTFSDCSALTSISLPETITAIEDNAFSNCSALKSINNPNVLVRIGNSAFYGCSSLTEVAIPNSVTSIGDKAFNGCDALSKLTIEDCEMPILFGNDIFSISLESVYLGRNVSYTESNRIKESPLANQTKLKSVIISELVSSIGSSAFRDCSSLMGMTIPNSVTEIGDNAFNGCSSLTEIIIPNSVTSIGAGAFSSCSSLMEVTIPNSVTEIGGSAFYGCSSLTGVTISNSATSIGDNVFNGCSSLMEVTIPNSVISIGAGAFNGCSSLTEVIIPNSVNLISDNAFRGCPITTLTIEDGESVLSFGLDVFSGSMKSVYLGRNISYKVGEIDRRYSPFKSSSLSSVIISESVTSIEHDLFYGCSNLKNIYSLSIIPPYASGFTYNVSYIGEGKYRSSDLYDRTTLCVPEEAVEAYKSAYSWSRFESIQAIASISFNNEALEVYEGKMLKINVAVTPADASVDPITWSSSDESVATVDSNGWVKGVSAGMATITATTGAGNSATCTVTVKPLLKAGGLLYSFNDTDMTCTLIGYEGDAPVGDLVIPEAVNGYRVTALGEHSLSGCKEITSVKIPAGVTSIGDWAFYNNTLMQSVEIPDGVSYVGLGAFCLCRNLTSVTFPNSVTTIGMDVFSGCSSLTRVVLPESIEMIDNGVFFDCPSLSEITIPESVTSIGDYVFSGCAALKEVTLPKNLTTIGKQAFASCSGLTSISIPNSVTSIGTMAFSSCSSLEKIYCHAAVPPTAVDAEGYSAFYKYDGVTLYVPEGSAEAYKSTDPWSRFFVKEFDPAGIEDVVSDGASGVTVEGGAIVVDAPEGATVEVYAITGVLVRSTREHRIEGLAHGVYIVRVGNKVNKVIVNN